MEETNDNNCGKANWNDNSAEDAVREYNSHHGTLCEIAQKYGVSKSKLQRDVIAKANRSRALRP